MPLIPEQRAALWRKDGLPFRGYRIISARPGTGKTTTLTEYCMDIVDDWWSCYAAWQGIAVVSYTNVAREELERKMRNLGKASCLLAAPHFVGTIDAFLNQYLFLPFGGTRMNYVGARPKLVGEPYRQWRPSWAFVNGAPDDASSPWFFDCYSLGPEGAPFRTDATPREIGNNPARRPVEVSLANSVKIIKMKEYVWSQGYTLQSDANYISYSALTSSAALTRSLARRFPVLVIDEAQDMTEVQHALIDHLGRFGERHIVLVGDEHQAIYEWNTARPQLFIAKKTDAMWNGRSLTETFRCSPGICAVLTNMTADGATLSPASAGKNTNYDAPVQVRTYDPNDEGQDVVLAIDELARALSEKGAHNGNVDDIKIVAIVTQSRDDAARLQAYFAGGAARPNNSPTWDDKLTKDYLRLIHYLLRKDTHGAVGAYETLLSNTADYDSKPDMRITLSRAWGAHSPDLLGYRIVLFRDLRQIEALLPAQIDVDISGCAAFCDVALNGVSSATLAAIKRDCQSFGGVNIQVLDGRFVHDTP